MVVTFLIFYIIILTSQKKNLINWGFLIMTHLLIYSQMSFQKTKKVTGMWKVIVIYSSIVILANITFIFLKTPYIVNKKFVTNLQGLVPDILIKEQTEFIGLIESKDNLWKKFIPYLTFFIISVYVERQQGSWIENDEKIVASI